MQVWAIANQKGGVGKTTSAVNLAGLLAKRGKRVLMVDMDPHGSLTSYLKFDNENLSSSLYDLFDVLAKKEGALAKSSMARTLKRTLLFAQIEGIKLIPSAPVMATLDRRMGAKQGMGLALRQILAELEGDFDYALLDCPPVLGLLLVNAVAASDHLLIPVQTEYLAIKGLERMLKTVDMVKKSLNKTLPYTIIPTLYDQRTRAARESLAILQRDFEAKYLWGSSIPVDTHFRDASSIGLPLSHAGYESQGLRAYADLLDALLAASVSTATDSLLS